MLPNRKTISKQNPLQIDLVDTISADDKIQSKRRTLLIILLLTVGVSFIFWTYRFVAGLIDQKASISFSLPTFSRPNISSKSFSQPNDSSLKSAVSPILDSTTSSWSIFVQQLPAANSSQNWSLNFHQAPDLNSILPLLQPRPDNSLLSVLPQGIEVSDHLASQDPLDYYLLVSTPTKKIIMDFRANSPEDEFEQMLPHLVEAIYWHIMPQI